MSSLLFSPLKIRDVTFKNRIVVSPMCQYSSVEGFSNDWHLVHLGSRAVGGAGLILTEATAVSPEARISPHDLGIWDQEHIAGLQRITKFISENGSVPGIQLAHAGRKASKRRPWEGEAPVPLDEGGWNIVAPSAIPFSEQSATPLALDAGGIKKVIRDFGAAAKRSVEAGFKVVEIHAAHGYLIHQFLSPFSNKRTDEYGGSFENRVRLLLEIVEEVRKNWPLHLPLFIRISSSDWKEEGWRLEDSISVTNLLKTKEIDVIDCSSGGIIPHVKIPNDPGYQVPFAASIKKETQVMTAAVGLITSAAQSEKILADGKADLILLAREFLRDPYFPLHAADELHADQSWPLQYERAKPR